MTLTITCVDFTGNDAIKTSDGNNNGEFLSSSAFVSAAKQLLEKGCKVINCSFGRPLTSQGYFNNDTKLQQKYGDYDKLNQTEVAEAKEYSAAVMIMIVELILSKNDNCMFVQAAGNGFDNKGPGHSAEYYGFFAGITEELYNTLSAQSRKKLKDCGISYKGIKNHVLIVGAIEKNKRAGEYCAAHYSNYGSTVDLFAPGSDVYSTILPPTLWGNDSGTSMAAPIVTGSVSLLWAIEPSLSSYQIKEYLLKESHSAVVGSKDSNNVSSYPLLNIGTATKTLIKEIQKENQDHDEGECIVSGVVKDKNSDKALSGVTVTFTNNVSNEKCFSETDETGQFSNVVPYGKYTVGFNKDGYYYYGRSLTVDSDKLELSDAVLLNQIEKEKTDDTIIANGKCGDDINYTINDKGVLTINGKGEMWNYDPQSYFKPPWNHNSSIKTIVIKDGVTSIGDHAFDQLFNCLNVTIPDSVTTIGNRAFFRCENLTSITIPANVTSIGEFAFYYCCKLTSLMVPDSVTSIGDSAFEQCICLSKATIPNSVTSIGKYAFRGCSELSEIDVSVDNQVYSSDNGVLFDKTKKTLIVCPAGKSGSYKIPNSTTIITDNAFNYCHKLTNVTIPKSVTTIGERAFVNCVNLDSVSIPNSVTSIGEGAFAGCNNLTNVSISKKITIIGIGTFQGCKSLMSVTIPDNVKSIENSAFYNCHNLADVVISNGVTSIGPYAFSGCGRLKSVTIPVSVSSIGNNAFGYLENTFYTGTEEQWERISIGYYNSDLTRNITYSYSTSS